MKVLFLDESGDHSLSTIDPSYPLFVLGGVIMDQDYAEGPATDAINAFKRRMFGTTDIVLHTADMNRNRNGFEEMKNPAFRARFYEQLNELMMSLEYSVIACVIRKERHLARYGLSSIDPYLWSLEIIVERFCMDVGDVAQGGVMIAERRDRVLDQQLELAWLNLRIGGTHYLNAAAIQRRILSLNLRGKTDDVAGLELADLVVSPVGRHVLGMHDNEDWRIVSEKLRRSRRGQVEGYGLIVLPK